MRDDRVKLETFIKQRKKNDCGAAALATFFRFSYEEVEIDWRVALGRETNQSNYADLIKVAECSGFTLERVPFKKSEGMRRIVRVRPWRGSNHSHWIVMFPEGSIWCPYSGRHDSLLGYEQPWPGHSLIIKE